MKRQYEKALQELSKGCCVEKKIRGHKYYYLAFREGKKVIFIYKKLLSNIISHAN
jgi:hypothetical protein